MIDHLVAAGGGEGALVKILRLLPRDRFRYSVVTLKWAIGPDILRSLPCPAHSFELDRTYSWKALQTAYAIRRLIRSENVDIVHTFFETSNTWGGIVAKLSGAPRLVSSRRDMGILQSPKHRLAYRVINRICDRVLTVSEMVRRQCVEGEHIDPAKVVRIYNGMEFEQVAAVREAADLTSLGIPADAPVITTVANIRPVKGIDIFIRAAALVLREFPQTYFLVVGAVNEPDTAAELLQLARSLAIENNVKFSGLRDDVLQILRRSKVFCMLSRSEGFSNAVLEAMASEVPCVVTRVGGNPEAIDEGVTGYLVPSEDFAAAADRITYLLRNPEQAARIGRAAREVVRTRFSSERMISDLTQFYESLVETP